MITFKNLPDTTTPINADNLNANFNELKSNYNYSTSETVIGTWINGKPLYRKVYEGEVTGSYGTIGTVPAFSKAVNISGSLLYQNTRYSLGSDTISVIVSSSGNIQIYSNKDDWSGFTYDIIIEYTKTTD